MEDTVCTSELLVYQTKATMQTSNLAPTARVLQTPSGVLLIVQTPTVLLLIDCELALLHGGGMGVAELAATAGSNRWVP